MTRRQIVRALRASLIGRKSRQGKLPLGLRYKRTASGRVRVVPVPSQIRTLGRMVVLRRAGFTYEEIARQLDAEDRTTRTGTPWSHWTVSTMLSRLEEYRETGKPDSPPFALGVDRATRPRRKHAAATADL